MKWESYSHPISDIRDWDNNHRLELKPDFQRNEVWSRVSRVTWFTLCASTWFTCYQ